MAEELTSQVVSAIECARIRAAAGPNDFMRQFRCARQAGSCGVSKEAGCGRCDPQTFPNIGNGWFPLALNCDESIDLNVQSDRRRRAGTASTVLGGGVMKAVQGKISARVQRGSCSPPYGDASLYAPCGRCLKDLVALSVRTWPQPGPALAGMFALNPVSELKHCAVLDRATRC